VGDSSPAPEDPVQIGTVLDGRYRIDAMIGSGGMGKVYRAEHTGIGRPVAIKLLHAEFGSNREAVTRFQREALASGRLDHTNIVAVTDFGVLEGVGFFLVMEALDGESLGARLLRGRMPWGEALVILSGVLAGLRHAHDRGVVHRDIKPDNVFLAQKEGVTVVKILDFGIAKLYAGAGDDPATTRAGLTVGTPAYLSPEQAVGGAITPASDLYSTTCVLFEMLTGRPPFEGKDPLAMLTSHVGRPAPTLREIVPDLVFPPALDELIARGLMKIAGERIGSATEYLAAVQGILGIAAPGQTARGSQPAIAVPAEPVPSPPVVPPRASTAPPHADAAIGAATTALATPQALKVVSLGDFGEPVARRWLVLGIVGLAVVAAAGIAVAIASGGSSNDGELALVDAGAAGSGDAIAPAHRGVEPPHNTSPHPGGAQLGSAHPVAPPPPPAIAPPPPVSPLDDEETRYQALIKQLQHGKDCTERKAAIPQLVELGDPRAVDALKRARQTACLTSDADAAVKKLTPR
jgi:serine/threonine-protein kinase